MEGSQHSEHELQNPDNLVAGFYQWRMEYEKMEAKTEKLQKELELKELQLLMATTNNNSLKNEILHLSSSVQNLQNTIQKLLHFEVENTELVIKVAQIEEKMQAIQKDHERTNQSAQTQILEMRNIHVTEITGLKKQLELEAQANSEEYKKIIYEKELEILHQVEHLKILEKQHDEEIKKTKLEYDHKLMKTQEKAKSIKSAPKVTISTNASAGIDILRKKMQNMQHLHDLETSELKEKLAKLQEKLQICKQVSSSEEKQHSPLHNLTLKRRTK